jgi:hypothetical protein
VIPPLCSDSFKLGYLIGYADSLASFHPGGNLALQFDPAGQQSGGFQNVSGGWIVIQREQKCKAICVCVETMPTVLFPAHHLAFISTSNEQLVETPPIVQ